MMRKSSLLIASAALLLGPVVIGARQTTPTLSALDYEEIRRAEAYWIHGSDMGDRNMLMHAFVPGGVLKRPARVGSCRNSDVDCVAVQRPLDAQLPKGPMIPDIPYQHVATGCLMSKEKGCIRQHYIQDLLIEATPGGARAVAHLFV